jgi:hypothetical protein
MTIDEVVMLAKATLPKPMLNENYSKPAMIGVCNGVIRRIIRQLYSIAEYMYLGDLLHTEAGIMTAIGEKYSFDLTTLENDFWIASIAAWVDSEAITPAECQDSVPVVLSDRRIIPALSSYSMTDHLIKVFGEIEGNNLIIHSQDYSYVCVKYIEKPSNYADGGDDIALSDDIIEDLVIPLLQAKMVRVDKDSIESANYYTEFKNNLNDLKIDAHMKVQAVEQSPPDVFDGMSDYDGYG